MQMIRNHNRQIYLLCNAMIHGLWSEKHYPTVPRKKPKPNNKGVNIMLSKFDKGTGKASEKLFVNAMLLGGCFTRMGGLCAWGGMETRNVYQ